MNIKHFCNSFISVTCGKTTVICDPWVGMAQDASWRSYPYSDNGAALVRAEKPDYIYISHVHADHLHIDLLRELDKDIPFIIKYFENQHLVSRIKALGFTNVTEIEPWTPFELNDDLDIAIVQASFQFKDDIEAQLEYDLDTSIHFRDKRTGQVFFNNVDTPNNVDDLKKNQQFARDHWGRAIDVACLPVGAASYYPQNFINLDRDTCMGEIIDRSLAELPNRVAAIGAPHVFIAGGTYVIAGKFAPLNRWIAQPTFGQIQDKMASVPGSEYTMYDIEGGGTLIFDPDKGKWQREHNREDDLPDLAIYIQEGENIPYDYSHDISEGRILETDAAAEISTLFTAARKNYHARLKQNGVTRTWDVTFKLYKDVRVDRNGDLVQQTPLLSLRLGGEDEPADITSELIIHVDADLFRDVMTKKVIGGVLASSYALVERRPNIFIPDAEFTLNLLAP